MSAETPTTEGAETSESNRDYAVAVCVKQCGLSASAALAKVESLGDASEAALVAAGRAGRLAEVRNILAAA